MSGRPAPLRASRRRADGARPVPGIDCRRAVRSDDVRRGFAEDAGCARRNGVRATIPFSRM